MTRYKQTKIIGLGNNHFLTIYEDYEDQTVEAFLYSPGEPELVVYSEKYATPYDYVSEILAAARRAIPVYDTEFTI